MQKTLNQQNEMQKREKKLIELTTEELEEIANYKQKTTVEVLGARVGKVLQKYKMGKYISWKVTGDNKEKESTKHKLLWSKKWSWSIFVDTQSIK